MAGIELFGETAREAVDTAVESRAFSQENFITDLLGSFSLEGGEERIYFS